MRITTVFVVLFLTMSPALGNEASDFLYVWAWDKAGDNGDFLAVIDVNENSPTFGK